MPKRRTFEEFIQKAKKIHGDKYDLSKVFYVNLSTKICVICKKHGEFLITPYHFIEGHGCKKCYDERRGNTQKLTQEQFNRCVKEIHGDKYDLSKAVYKNYDSKVCVICPIHGEFLITPHNLLSGHGCKFCGGTYKKTTEEFINNAKKVHGEKYIYSKVNYKGALEKVEIICPIHGSFWQTPHEHLKGCGCSNCKASHLENEISLFCQNNNIEFIEQYKPDWLSPQSLDFYLPQYNVAIECQGEQHFKGWNGNEKSLKDITTRDIKKKHLCDENGIQLLYYSNLGIDYPYHVFENKEELLKEIKQGL